MKRFVAITVLLFALVGAAFGQDPLTIYPSGDVGIGTSAPPYDPAEKLEVIGGIKSTDRIYDETGLVMPVGAILPYAGSTAPEGWLLCNGVPVSRIEYADLFTVIGVAYGPGDGSTTFNIPNLQGLSPTGVGTQTINGRNKAGPALGQVREDEMQGHKHYFLFKNEGAAGSSKGIRNGTQNGPDISNPITDGTNGTPRIGAYTHGPEIGVNFIIKY